MRKIIMMAALLAGLSIGARAQVRVGINVNIGAQPVWGPAGYDYAEYYYLPDLDVYYYVPRRQFIYLSGGRWVFSTALPPRYRDYDLYSGYKAVINQPRPYLYADRYRERYAGYRGRHDQRMIRDYPGRGYQRHDNGHHYGWYKHENGRGHGHRHGRD